jgi:hypothetical protein
MLRSVLPACEYMPTLVEMFTMGIWSIGFFTPLLEVLSRAAYQLAAHWMMAMTAKIEDAVFSGNTARLISQLLLEIENMCGPVRVLPAAPAECTPGEGADEIDAGRQIA